MMLGARHQQGGGHRGGDQGGNNRSELPLVEETETLSFFSRRNALECFLGGIGVFTLCMFGQEFYKVAGTLAAPLWPSSGLALALLLLRGWRLFPAITFGTIAATVSFGDNPIFTIAGSVGNTLESLIGWFLMTRLFDFSNQMQRVRDIMLLLILGAQAGPILNSVICTAGLVLPGLVKPEGIPISLLCFWTGNMLGIIVFTPLFLALLERRPIVSKGIGLRQTIIWLALLTAIVTLGFFNRTSAHTGLYPIAYLSFPVMVWLALSMRHGVTLAITLVTTMVTGFTTLGYGPLLRSNPMATYAELSVFIALFSIACLIIMAVEEERTISSTKSQLAIKTAGLGQWEWSVKNGLIIHDHPFPPELGLESGEVNASQKFMHLLDPSDFHLLPWIQQVNACIGETINAEVHLNDRGEVIIFLLSGSVEKTDSKGRPTEFLGVLRNVTAERKATELRIAAARRESELRNLRSTLNPHFLFNSLNVLKSLIVEDASKAQRAVLSLAELLRSSLRATRQSLIPLRDELSVIRSFLNLQKMRYEGRLNAILSIEAGTEGIMIPPMLLQQLVENSVKHGVDPSISGGEIRVEVLLERDHLLLITKNPGAYAEGPHDGLGLQSVREQLDSIYGSGASFHIGNMAEGMVRAEVRIPLRKI